MKLVNPRGRSVDELTNQANAGCACSINADGSSDYASPYQCANHGGGCACNCAYGSANSSANQTMGKN